MTTLQEYLNEKYPTKEGKERAKCLENRDWDFGDKEPLNIITSSLEGGKLNLSEFVNLENVAIVGCCLKTPLTELDISGCVKLRKLIIFDNQLTSTEFLTQLPNLEKLELLMINNNNIQPTNIEVFSRFVNLKKLYIGTMKHALEKNKHNQFYGSLKSYQNLTKLEVICIEATDVNEGLEYLPKSLVEKTRGGNSEIGGSIQCSIYETNAKCKVIQDELRPFNYDLEAWQLAHPELMAKVRGEKNPVETEQRLGEKISETKKELSQTKLSEPNKDKRIARLENKLAILEEEKRRLSETLDKVELEKKNLQKEVSDLKSENQFLKDKMQLLEKENLLLNQLLQQGQKCLICKNYFDEDDLNWKKWCINCHSEVEVRFKDNEKSQVKQSRTSIAYQLVKEKRDKLQTNIEVPPKGNY